MTYSALDDVGEAYEATRALLVPFDLRRWLGLAVVVFFVSGATGFDPSSNLGFVDRPVPFGPGPAATVRDPGSFVTDPGFGAFVLLAGAAVLVALAVGFVAAVMEFAFVRILERRDVSVRAYVQPNTRKGLSLFGLRLLLALALIATFTLLFALAVSVGVAFLAVVLLLSPVIVIGLVGVYLFHRFTVDFVVPVMLVDDVGVVEGWRRLLTEIRSDLPEYGVYALVRFGIGILAAIVSAIGFTMVAIVVGIPFAIVAAVFYAVGVLLSAGAVVTVLLWSVAALYAIVVTIVGVTLVQVPVSSYLRYYSLLVLADVSPDYDVVAGVRAHLGDGAPPAGGVGGSGPGGAGGASGTSATARDEEADVIELPEDVTETRPKEAVDEVDDEETIESETDDSETDDSETDDSETDDSETDDSKPVDPEYRTETEEPERYRPDDTDEGR